MAKELSNTIAHVVTANYGGCKNNGEELSSRWYTPSIWGVEAMVARVGESEAVQSFKEVARIAINEIGALQVERSHTSPFQPSMADLYDLVIGFGEEGGKWVVRRLWAMSRELKSWTTEQEVFAQAWNSQYSSFEDTRKIFRVLVAGTAEAIRDGKRNQLKNILRKGDVKFVLRYAAGEDFVTALYEPDKAQRVYNFTTADAEGNWISSGMNTGWQWLIECAFRGETVYYSSYIGELEHGGYMTHPEDDGAPVVGGGRRVLKPEDLTADDREVARQEILNYLVESQAELSGEKPGDDDPEAAIRSDLTELFSSWRQPGSGEFYVEAYVQHPDEEDEEQLWLSYYKTNPAPEGVEFEFQTRPYTDAWETLTEIGVNLHLISFVKVGFVPEGEKFLAGKVEDRIWRRGEKMLQPSWCSL